MQSWLGNKRKWVSLPLEDASRDDADKVPSGGPNRSDAEPNNDSPDPTSPNQTLSNSRPHDSTRSKWPAAYCFLFSTFAPLSWLADLLFAFYPTDTAACLLTTPPRCHLSFQSFFFHNAWWQHCLRLALTSSLQNLVFLELVEWTWRCHPKQGKRDRCWYFWSFVLLIKQLF